MNIKMGFNKPILIAQVWHGYFNHRSDASIVLSLSSFVTGYLGNFTKYVYRDLWKRGKDALILVKVSS
jgi:hypothetical protein